MKRKGTAIPRRAAKLIRDLRQLYPMQAAKMMLEIAIANGKGRKLPEWRQKQLESFITMLGLSARDLERAYLEKRLTTLAWATRNLLELSIWIDYCNLSEANAKSFRDDMVKDLFGLSKAIHKSVEVALGKSDKGLESKITDLKTFAQSKGIQKLGDDFKRVSDAAKQLGREDAFKSTNKFLSKLAHPTAWAIHTVASVEADEGLRWMFLADGVSLAINSLIGIMNFARGIYPEVAMTAKEAEASRKEE